MSDTELVNGLRHMADDHPCCEATILHAIDKLQQLERENAALREERVLWEAKCHELIAPHYILNPDLRAAKFREALRFHPVLNLKAQAIIHAARKEAQP